MNKLYNQATVNKGHSHRKLWQMAASLLQDCQLMFFELLNEYIK